MCSRRNKLKKTLTEQHIDIKLYFRTVIQFKAIFLQVDKSLFFENAYVWTSLHQFYQSRPEYYDRFIICFTIILLPIYKYYNFADL